MSKITKIIESIYSSQHSFHVKYLSFYNSEKCHKGCRYLSFFRKFLKKAKSCIPITKNIHTKHFVFLYFFLFLPLPKLFFCSIFANISTLLSDPATFFLYILKFFVITFFLSFLFYLSIIERWFINKPIKKLEYTAAKIKRYWISLGMQIFPRAWLHWPLRWWTSRSLLTDGFDLFNKK